MQAQIKHVIFLLSLQCCLFRAEQFANHICLPTCYEKYFIFKSIKSLILADDFKLHIIV